jgi:hypothetical protein
MFYGDSESPCLWLFFLATKWANTGIGHCLAPTVLSLHISGPLPFGYLVMNVQSVLLHLSHLSRQSIHYWPHDKCSLLYWSFLLFIKCFQILFGLLIGLLFCFYLHRDQVF